MLQSIILQTIFLGFTLLGCSENRDVCGNENIDSYDPVESSLSKRGGDDCFIYSINFYNPENKINNNYILKIEQLENDYVELITDDQKKMSYLMFNKYKTIEKIKEILNKFSITDYSIQKYNENCVIKYEEKYKNGVLDLQDMNIKLYSLQNKIEQLENKNKNYHLKIIKEINANRKTLNKISVDARKYRKNYGILKYMQY